MNTGWSSFRTCGWDGAALIGGIRAADWWLSMGIAVQMLSVVPVLGFLVDFPISRDPAGPPPSSVS